MCIFTFGFTCPLSCSLARLSMWCVCRTHESLCSICLFVCLFQFASYYFFWFPDSTPDLPSFLSHFSHSHSHLLAPLLLLFLFHCISIFSSSSSILNARRCVCERKHMRTITVKRPIERLIFWILWDSIDRECLDIDQQYAFYRVDCKNPCQWHLLLFAVAVIPAFQPICESACLCVCCMHVRFIIECVKRAYAPAFYRTEREILRVQVNDKTKFIY